VLTPERAEGIYWRAPSWCHLFVRWVFISYLNYALHVYLLLLFIIDRVFLLTFIQLEINSLGLADTSSFLAVVTTAIAEGAANGTLAAAIKVSKS